MLKGDGSFINFSEAFMVATGIIGVLKVGFLLDKTKAYKLVVLKTVYKIL